MVRFSSGYAGNKRTSENSVRTRSCNDSASIIRAAGSCPRAHRITRSPSTGLQLRHPFRVFQERLGGHGLYGEGLCEPLHGVSLRLVGRVLGQNGPKQRLGSQGLHRERLAGDTPPSWGSPHDVRAVE